MDFARHVLAGIRINGGLARATYRYYIVEYRGMVYKSAERQTSGMGYTLLEKPRGIVYIRKIQPDSGISTRMRVCHSSKGMIHKIVESLLWVCKYQYGALIIR